MFAKIWLVRLPMGIPAFAPLRTGRPIKSSLSLSLRKAFRNFSDELTRCWTPDLPENGIRQNAVIHAVEKLSDVRPPDETTRMGGQEFLGAPDACQKALALTARPGVIGKGFVEDGHEVIVKQTMNDPVANARAGYFALFVITDGKFPVSAMTIGSVHKVALKTGKVFLKIKLETMQLSRHLLALAVSEPASPDIS